MESGQENLKDRLWTLALWVGGGIAAIIVLGLLALATFRIGWVDYVENYQLGYKFDSRTGTTEVLNHTGYVVNPPIVVSVYGIDLRPRQVCISANSRTLNCKLVKFNPEGLDLFLSWHGNGNYNANLDDILKSYAYEGAGKTYPFLTVLRDMTTKDLTLPDMTPADSAVPNLITTPIPVPPATAPPE